MAPQTPDDQPPSWLADPSGYQAPPAPTQYQDWAPESETQRPPESFVPVRPTHTQSQPPAEAQNDGGFQISFGGYTLTGWHAMVVIALVLGAWTSVNLYWDVSTNAAAQLFWSAPACGGAITDSCRVDGVMPVTYELIPGGASCVIHAEIRGSDWKGTFPSPACSGLAVYDASARVMLWRGQVVFIERRDIGHLDQQFWATDSVVGQHGEASSNITLPLYVDLFYVIALVLALIYRFVNPFRRR